MAKVSLRIYNREIENLVESGQLDEAIAHCRHILNAFPKHLETYRLLGKAYLEAKRYKEASDIFERILMAVPDDFVSHVGMSIMHDEKNSMDAAIWHMERAFEVQPSNAAIQAELQRLYGRRDGMEPPKIRLTRGALAHMYVQGELYPQAISEINGVLEEDPNRHDMQVLLARAYFYAGQKSEAAEICSQLLRRYPYCFDANRVLVELIPQTERGESTQVYRHRITELDPYSTFATGSVFHTDEVADAAVNLERLEWDGESIDLQPGWGDSLGIGRSGEKPAARDGDDQPEWLKAALVDDSAPASSPDEEPAPASGGLPVPTEDGKEDEIPDFLREAGWGQDTGTFQEGSGTFDETDDSSAEGAIAQGDLPDWVKAMAPSDADVEESASPPAGPTPQQQEDLTQDDVPDWLQGLGDVQSAPPSEQPSASEEGLPDWMGDLKAEEEPAAAPQENIEPVPADDLPDWLGDLKSPEESAAALQESIEPTPAGDMPDWLGDLKAEEEPAAVSQESIEPAAAEGVPDWLEGLKAEEEPAAAPQESIEPTPAGDVPDWLGDLKAEEEPAAAPQESIEPTPAGDMPDWLGDLKAEEESAAAPQESIEPTPTEDMPDWLEGLKAEEEPTAASQETSEPATPQAEDEGLPDWLGSEKPEEQAPLEAAAITPESLSDWNVPADVNQLGTTSEEQDDAVAWLENLASKHGAKPEELVTDPNARKETAPDWVQQATQAGQEQEQPPAQAEPAPPAPEEITPSAAAPVASVDSLGTSAEEQDDAVAWLENLASKHGAKPEELVTDPNARKETAPDWVQQATQAGQEHEQPPAEAEPASPAPEEVTPSAAAPVASVDSLGTSAEEQDDAVAWLENLASKHGAKPEELVTDPDARKDTAPDWVQQAAQASQGQQEQEQPSTEEPVEEGAPPIGEPAEEEPEWMKHAKEVGETLFSELEDAQTKEPLPSADMDETGMWLRDMDAESEITEEQTTTTDDSVEPAAAGGVPDWLAGLDSEESGQEVAPETEAPVEDVDGPHSTEEAEPAPPAWLSGMESRVPDSDDAIESIQQTETGELPSWLDGLDEKEAQPAAATDVPDWLQQQAVQETAQPEPTSPADWKPVDTTESVQETPPPAQEVAPATPELQPASPSEREPYREPVTRSRSGMTGMLSQAEDPTLHQAQIELTRSNIPDALENYSKLIKKGKMLDEIIFDLREALYRYPVEVSIHQTLGDAYMRANRLQDALDSYTKAEELLR